MNDGAYLHRGDFVEGVFENCPSSSMSHRTAMAKRPPSAATPSVNHAA